MYALFSTVLVFCMDTGGGLINDYSSTGRTEHPPGAKNMTNAATTTATDINPLTGYATGSKEDILDTMRAALHSMDCKLQDANKDLGTAMARVKNARDAVAEAEAKRNTLAGCIEAMADLLG